MTFLTPIGLLGLLSLPVILILHMMRERHRRYIISDLSLWSFLDNEVRGPRTRRIPITTLLLLDLLIGALFSLALAQPRLMVTPPGAAARHMVILLDVSTSMRAADGLENRFAQAKATALALVENSRPQDVITFVVFGREARIIADSRQDGAAQLTERISAQQAGETAGGLAGDNFKEALAMGQAALDPTLPAEFHLITDGEFALENLDETDLLPYPYQWHFIGRPVENQAVIDLNTTPLGENRMQVFARIANYSATSTAREIALEINGRPVDRSTVNLQASSTLSKVWDVIIEPSQRPAEVRAALTGSDGLAEDDSAVMGTLPFTQVHILLVAENPAALEQAIQAVPGAELTILTPQAYAAQLGVQPAGSSSAYDLTIFRNYMPPAWPPGNVLVVEPPTEPANADPSSPGLNLVASTQASIPANIPVQVASPHPLVNGIDFSGVRWNRIWLLDESLPDFIPLLEIDTVPVLLWGEIEHTATVFSRVVVLLADLSQGNFTKHPSFPIFMANLVDSARQRPLPLIFKTGENLPLPSAGSYQSIQITPPGQPTIELNGDWLSNWPDTLNPGLYRFRFIQPDGRTVDFSAGGMAGDEFESDLRDRDWNQAARSRAGSAAVADSPEEGIDLRPVLLGLAILILFAESILAWRS